MMKKIMNLFTFAVVFSSFALCAFVLLAILRPDLLERVMYYAGYLPEFMMTLLTASIISFIASFFFAMAWKVPLSMYVDYKKTRAADVHAY